METEPLLGRQRSGCSEFPLHFSWLSKNLLPGSDFAPQQNHSQITFEFMPKFVENERKPEKKKTHQRV